MNLLFFIQLRHGHIARGGVRACVPACECGSAVKGSSLVLFNHSMGVAPKSAEFVLVRLVRSKALYGSSCIVVVSLALKISQFDRCWVALRQMCAVLCSVVVEGPTTMEGQVGCVE